MVKTKLKKTMSSAGSEKTKLRQAHSYCPPGYPEGSQAVPLVALLKGGQDGHIESGTWEKVLLKNVPPNRNILRGKWILSDKRGQDGKIQQYKARFVAMGNTQQYMVDYKETFAGVVVVKSFQIMLLNLNEDPSHKMEHWDVKKAFHSNPSS